MSSIYEFVKTQRDSYRSDTIEITEGYDFSQYETLRTIELYHNSKFLSTNKDSLGREKPFYNICKFRVNVATRATDLDTKDVRIESERANIKAYAASFILNLKNRNWMKIAKLATFLNRMGHTRAKAGGVIVKKIEHGDTLSLHVMQWLNMITDQVDIRNGVKIERHYYDPDELRQKAKELGWSNVKEAIEAAKNTREANAANNPAKKNKVPGAKVEVFEVHGVLSTDKLAGTSDKYPDSYGKDDEYERQMHVLVLDESVKDGCKGVTLYAGIEDEDPYKYLPYEEVDGRGLGVGVVEDLFEAQVWTNDSVKKKKDMLDLAGKIIFQTFDQTIAAKNVLTDIENGTILTPAKDMPITQVNNVPTTLPAFDQVREDWDQQAERVSSTYAAITGETMPSGTPYRQTEILNEEAGSLFEYRREEAGQFIQEIYMDWVLPFLAKQIKSDKQLTATLEPEELEYISDALAQYEASKFAKEKMLKGELVTPEDVQAHHANVRDSSMKSPRKEFENFAKLFDGWQGNVDVITTGEQENKAVVLETFNSALAFIAKMQLPDGRNLALEDGPMRTTFMQLVEHAGMSPLLFPRQRAGAPTPSPIAATPKNAAPSAV